MNNKKLDLTRVTTFNPDNGCYESPPFRELTKINGWAEIIEWGSAIQISNHTLRVGLPFDYGRTLWVSCYGKLIAGKDVGGKYPTTWWDAFKKRWFPRWLLKRYPCNYTEYITYKICPHIEIPQSDEKHFEFLKD